MHRLLCPFAKGGVDHINGNGLWNSRSNLRPATHSQNGSNQAKTSRKTSSIYKGVCWNKKNSAWCASIGIMRKHLGYFKSDLEAAKAYDKAAIAKYGEFARLNFPS